MKQVSISIFVITLALSGCKALSGGMPDVDDVTGGGGSGGELTSECRGDFGADAAAAKLEAFMGATGKVVDSSKEIDARLVAACKDMGRELGLSDSEMQASGDTPAARAACNPVAAKIRSELGDLRAQGQLGLIVEATPPRCEVSVDAYAQCSAECNVEVDPGQLKLECEGGELSGKCSAQCEGSCSAEVSGECKGQCEGTCEGGCRGVCNGVCEGKCSKQGEDGKCAGRCSGTCKGSCSARCRGNCQGSCVVEARASCEGECRGGCSVDFEAPRCSGELRAPSASAECSASCDASLNAEASCEPGYVYVSVSGEASGDLGERVGRLRAAIEGGLGNVEAIRLQLERMVGSGEAMVKASVDLPGAVAGLGLQAAQCVRQAGTVLPDVVGSLGVSVEVSVSVSASASAGAGG